MPKDTLVKVGMFDERFKPCYYEDNDYLMRVAQVVGDKIYVTKKVTVLHLLSKDTRESKLPVDMGYCEKLYKEKWKL
jgi:GT2 family glycosyltransferase